VVSGELGTGGLSADAMHEIDTVFHLAGVAHVMPPREDGDTLYEAINIHGSRAVVEAAIAAGVRHFVYFSSVKAMGDPGDECVDERWAVLPEDPYGLSKKEAERLLLAAGKRTGMHITVLRPALVYGPGVKGNLFRMLKTIDSGRFPPLPDAVNRRSMVHVEDVVQAALLAAEKPAAVGQTYIVTDGQDCSTRQMYEWICEALGRPVPAWTMPIGIEGVGESG
jgi:nucleoside-diphosphate-sugar epimerase